MLEPSPDPQRAAFERFRERVHLPGLDGLRGLAILPVIWHHATPRPLAGLAGKGAVGVDLFFALSGLLITTLLLRERRARGTIGLAAFYARRSLRIFPLYYLTLGAYALWAATMPSGVAQATHFFSSLPYHASYTANWFVRYDVPHDVMFAFSWSLCVEEQFYAVWPVLIALSGRRLLLAGLMGGAIALDACAEHGLLGPWLAVGTARFRIATSFASPIGFGALLALTLDSRLGFVSAWRVLGQRWSAPALLALVLGLLALPASPYLPLSLSLAALVASAALREDSGLDWLLERRELRWIGRVSYAAYLLHVPALGVVRRALPELREHAFLTFALGLPLALAFAHAAHRLVERPIERLRARAR